MKTNYIQVKCIHCREQEFEFSVETLAQFFAVAFNCPLCKRQTLIYQGKREIDEPVLIISKSEGISELIPEYLTQRHQGTEKEGS